MNLVHQPSRGLYFVGLFLLITCVNFGSTLECLQCDHAVLYCDESTKECTHNCKNVTTCTGPNTGYGWACLAAKINKTQVYLDCFPQQERIPYYCLLADGLTCSCTNQHCNARLFQNTANIPPSEELLVFPEYNTRKVSNASYNESDTSDEYGNDVFPIDGTVATNIFIPQPSPEPLVIAFIILGTIVCIVVATSAIFFLVLKIRQKRRLEGKGTVTSNTDSTSLDLGTECSYTKGLNGTPPLSPSLYENSPLHLHLEEVVGRGRFGAVWRAEWKTRDGRELTVAVKVFYEFDSTSWNVEKELFNDPDVMLHHENIIRFIKAEVREISYPQPQRQYWLISQYYPKGTIQDYLSQKTVTWEQFCRMACDTATGVAHLHADIMEDDPPINKYPVAHRDLKSSNVLIQCDGSCVIADFGLALKLDPRASERDLANSGQVGTPRYMPPEALESKINLLNIESFKQMDVYSLGLIIWELARRCSVLSDVPDYELPYTEHLCDRHPTLDEMRNIVCKRQERPVIPGTWQEINGMNSVASTITECWDEDPEARLTASCVATRFRQFNEWRDDEQLKSSKDPHPTTVV